MKNILVIGAILALVYYFMRNKNKAATTVNKRTVYDDYTNPSFDLTNAIKLTLERVK